MGNAVELTNREFFYFKFTLRCKQSAIVPIPLVSLTPVVPVAKFVRGVVDTGVHLYL